MHDQIPGDPEPIALAKRYLRCPRCPSEELAAENGTLGEHECPRCGGAYVDRAGVGLLARNYLSLEPEQLLALETFVPKRALTCCECGAPMSLLTLRGARIDCCASCDSLWLDGGALQRLTAGKLGKPAPDRAREANGPAELWTKPRAAPRPPIVVARPITSDGWKALLIGAAFALLIPRFLLSILVTFFHELGHTLVYWIFAYPALGAFNWHHGGGYTASLDRSTNLMVLIYGACAYLLWRRRHRPRFAMLAIALIATYSVVAFTPLHQLLVLAMGHGMVLVIGGGCVVWILTGRGTNGDRPIVATVGLFMILQVFQRGWSMATSAEARELSAFWSSESGMETDLSRIAREYLGISVQGAAFLLLVTAVATPWLSYLAYRNGVRLINRANLWLGQERAPTS